MCLFTWVRAQVPKGMVYERWIWWLCQEAATDVFVVRSWRRVCEDGELQSSGHFVCSLDGQEQESCSLWPGMQEELFMLCIRNHWNSWKRGWMIDMVQVISRHQIWKEWNLWSVCSCWCIWIRYPFSAQ